MVNCADLSFRSGRERILPDRAIAAASAPVSQRLFEAVAGFERRRALCWACGTTRGAGGGSSPGVLRADYFACESIAPYCRALTFRTFACKVFLKFEIGLSTGNHGRSFSQSNKGTLAVNRLGCLFCYPRTGRHVADAHSLRRRCERRAYKESNMPLNLIVENLDNVPEALREHYVKRGKSFQLNLSDLESHVENQLKPLKSDLEITRAHERKLLVENGLGSALQRANIRPGYAELVIANIKDRVAIGTEDDKRVIRITAADGGMPMVGSGENGVATLDDLVKQAVESFPSMFEAGGKPATAKDDAGGSGPKIMTRAAFDALPPKERAAKMSDGFTIVDPPAKKPETRKLREKEMLRSEFDKLVARERAAKMNEGFKIVD